MTSEQFLINIINNPLTLFVLFIVAALVLSLASRS